VKLDVGGRILPAQLQFSRGDDRWRVRLGPVVIDPVGAQRLRARLADATRLERERLERAGYTWVEEPPSQS
jgi:hypothetical protein